MFGRSNSIRGFVAAALGAALLIPLSGVYAQQRGNSAANRSHAGHGWANRNTWAHQSANRRIGHAIDYSRDLRGYANYPSVAQPEEPSAVVPVTPYPVIVTEEIGRNIAAARQDLAVAKKAPQVAKDSEALKSFESIEKHLAAAAAQHAAMMDCCQGEQCDADELKKCCDAAVGELEKAQVENRKLMERLYPDMKRAAPKGAAEHTHEKK